MKCAQCQKEVDPSECRYCPQCGHSLYDEKIVAFIRSTLGRKRNIAILILLQIIVFSIIGYSFYVTNKSVAQKNKELADFANARSSVSAEWKPVKEIFPLTFAGDNEKLGELKVSSLDFSQIKTEIEVEGITEKKTTVISVKPETKDISLGAHITKEGFEKLKDSQNAKITIRVYDLQKGERMILEEAGELFIHSRNDIIWNKDGIDNTKYVLRLVNKDRPEIAVLIRDAAAQMKSIGGGEEKMLGVLGDNDDIRNQVMAIFQAMRKNYGIRYVATPFSYDSGEIQKVKFPEEVLATKSGICIDLSLLMVAAFESVGLDPVMVFVNNHVWPGVELGFNTNNFIFIEATALEKSPQEAMRIAEGNFKALQRKDTPSYSLVRVTEARSEGIFPLKY